ncbi:hypothetical protein [Nocardia australiensis]|uniref:hypothetical protein n=1 Tax=Nocardia australiensis TaxID=2887191 RepID=UPI001D147E77|nr:hypothetical protein [Nocardia australiensis]
MRNAIATVAALVGVIGGCVAVAGSANAVSDTSTCAATRDALEDYSSKNNAIDSSDPSASAESSRLWSGLLASLADISANADEGQAKTALNNALPQMHRIVTPNGTDLKTMMADPAFSDAMTGLDSACGF